MKLIPAAKPEIWEQEKGFIGMCEHIARCAAICYNSTPKTGGEAVDFVNRLIKKGHGRALEFGTFNAMACEGEDLYFPLVRMAMSTYGRGSVVDGVIRCTLNLRQVIENGIAMEQVEKRMDMQATESEYYDRRTIHYPAISRAIADEFRTHTTLSTLMQSTRYVNAAAEGDIEFIEPSWWSRAVTEQKRNFRLSIKGMEYGYIDAIKELGMKRQEARDLLPLCVKTEMVQCGFLSAWGNLIKLRTAKDAHPDAQWMADKVQDVFNSRQQEASSCPQ